MSSSPPPAPPSSVSERGHQAPPTMVQQQQQQHQQQQQQQQHSQQASQSSSTPTSQGGPTSHNANGGAPSVTSNGQQHYSLKWNNHQSHVLSAFDALLQNESLVDCTLVCDDTNIKAHKVVLSACSPYFQKIFVDNPGKHPIIVLKDVKGWEVQCIVDFMYKGETSVPEAQLQNLIRAAEGLRVRGLTSGGSESYTVEETRNPHVGYGRAFLPSPGAPRFHPHHHQQHPHHPEEHKLHPHPHHHLQSNQSSPMSLTHSHAEDRPRSPVSGSGPRRKQARPRRRSGDSIGNSSLDLSKAESPNSMGFNPHKSPNSTSAAHDDLLPENLSLKRPSSSPAINLVKMESLLEDSQHRRHTAATPSSAMHESEATSSDDIMDRKASPSVSSLSHHMDTRPPPHFHPSLGDHEANARVEALQALNFMAAGGGLPHFPHGHPGLPLPPHTSHMPTPASLAGLTGLTAAAAAASMGRPTSTPVTPSNYSGPNPNRKGQHSAPRGGPPRSWTNEDLTKALENVWHKRMTTSQASRVFGIPYNSLLMYVRGKYGKSLKLERLKQRTPAANDNLNTIGNSRTTPKEKLHQQEKLKMSPSVKRLGLDSRARELPNFGLSPATLAAAAARVSASSSVPSSTSGAFSPYRPGGLLLPGLPGLQEQIGLLRMLPSQDSSRVRDLMFNIQREQASSLMSNTPPRDPENKPEDATSPTIPSNTTLFALQQAAAVATAAAVSSASTDHKPSGSGSLGSTHSPESSTHDDDMLEHGDDPHDKSCSEEPLVMDDEPEEELMGDEEDDEEVDANASHHGEPSNPDPSESGELIGNEHRSEISAL
ncbi:protein jim lovell-like isoform X2 [Tigriopus californicus]|nr:protein jim lovell-like isoform X2 [Tigriopus californicus]XP_059098226.1 protein jim lovell-like isoform X2 [Tigriopus californicus]XP_059098227.1 protein jim lovell-like isoform X2 [Tigriopus californicus]XP_059098228.1 protein jim lovell-like isoform X2 [Tigriopus californicus]